MPARLESWLNIGQAAPIALPYPDGTATITAADMAVLAGIYGGISWSGPSTSIESGLSGTQNVRIVMTNEADAATLTATPPMVSTLPVGNLQLVSRARVARTAGLNDQVITGEMPATKILNCIALVGVNLTSASTIQLECWDQSAMGGHQTLDTGSLLAVPPIPLGDLNWGIDPFGASLMDGWIYRYVLVWFDAVQCVSFRITLSDSDNPDGYMEMSRLFMGNYFSPESNIAYGLRMSWVDDTEQYRTDGGTLRSDPLPSRRRWSFDLNALTDTERDQFLDHMRTVGRRSDLFLSCFPGAGGKKEINYAGHVKLTEIPEIEHHWPLIHRTQVVLEEV